MHCISAASIMQPSPGTESDLTRKRVQIVFNECTENFNYHYLRKPYLQVGWRTIVMRHDILILKWLFYLVGFVYLVWFTRKCESSSTRNFDLKWLLPWLWTCRIISIFRRMHILTYEFWCKWAEFFQKYNGWASSF